ncbi:ABC transporter substrate-binding protein [Myceligenerans crystallogenes]|uniref:ABC transporter substrate-binding protein n=1 Tax=Myceligenerans crystallogenes TaxID=316335 RepID=A0ABN2N613_9MICO
MKIRRWSAALAAGAAGALLFSACSSPLGGEKPAEADSVPVAQAEGPCKADLDLGDVTTAEGDIKVANESEIFGYNSLVYTKYSAYNNAVTERMIGSFLDWGTDGTICHDEEFGHFEATTDTQVVYTLSDAATWSDGTPVTYADYLLDWATQAITEDGTVTEDGSEVPLFDHIGGLYLGDFAPEPPEADAADAKEFTYNYERTNADWEILVTRAYPAHVVADQIGVTTDELVDAILELDKDVLRDAATFWNTGWDFDKPGELLDPALTPSSGPYMFAEDGWSAGQSVTLTANPGWWGTPPATRTITFRQIGADAQVQALANGDLDVIQPNGPTVDMVEQLEELGEAVHVETGQTMSWEHLDLNFAQGPFSQDEGGPAAREAFALCVPRQKIVDDLVKPVDESAVVLNARERLPYQDTYQEVVEASYDGRYDDVDLDAAREKFAEAGLHEGTKVEIAYLNDPPNPRRTDTVELIKASCDQVGFDVVDAGTGTFFEEEQPNGDFDAALFAWGVSGQVTAGEGFYATTGFQNYGGYSNETVDKAWKTVSASLDPAVHLEQTKIVEKQLWEDLFSLPLYSHPGLWASSSSVRNVRPMAAQSGIAWNADQWQRAG